MVTWLGLGGGLAVTGMHPTSYFSFYFLLVRDSSTIPALHQRQLDEN